VAAGSREENASKQKACCSAIEKRAGAANRTRTCDPVITNDVLYQLSYCGEPWRGFGAGRKRPHLISGAPRFCKKNGALEATL
jgi:hypothetical protein